MRSEYISLHVSCLVCICMFKFYNLSALIDLYYEQYSILFVNVRLELIYYFIFNLYYFSSLPFSYLMLAKCLHSTNRIDTALSEQKASCETSSAPMQLHRTSPRMNTFPTRLSNRKSHANIFRKHANMQHTRKTCKHKKNMQTYGNQVTVSWFSFIFLT